jgi:hypothetical protein
MTKAILPNRPPPSLVGLGYHLRKEQVQIANVSYKGKLEEIVAPFESRISFQTKSDFDGDEFVTNISPKDDFAGLNAADDPVSSLDLFKWLDEGTSERWVSMPEDFQQESTPNSLTTQHISYDRDDIFFFSEPVAGIEARNFLSQIDELYRNLYRLQMNQAIASYLNRV